MAHTLPAPLDVKLMNLTASVLVMGCVLLVLAAAAWWVLRYPGFAVARIVVQGDLVHNNAVTLRANVAPQGSYDYEHKYFTDDTQYHCPSGLSEAEEREIQRLVVQAFRSLGCRGWARADIMIRASDRKPFLLEMNTSPGMTGHSLVPMSARASGISYEDLCVGVLATATMDTPAGSTLGT